MVDSVNTSSALALIRAQHTQQSAAISNIRNEGKATQALINQLQKTASPGTQNAVTVQSPRLAGASSADILPRGSLVDRLA